MYARILRHIDHRLPEIRRPMFHHVSEMVPGYVPRSTQLLLGSEMCHLAKKLADESSWISHDVSTHRFHWVREKRVFHGVFEDGSTAVYSDVQQDALRKKTLSMLEKRPDLEVLNAVVWLRYTTGHEIPIEVLQTTPLSMGILDFFSVLGVPVTEDEWVSAVQEVARRL